MEATEGESSTQSKQDEVRPTSSRVQKAAKSKKASKKKLKVTTTKKKRMERTPSQPYTIHQGEDMLLVISNSQHPDWSPYQERLQNKRGGKRKLKQSKSKKPSQLKPKRRKKFPVVREEVVKDEPVSQAVSDNRWGENVPEEVLTHIFQLVVSQDGAVPFLCRVGSVCRLWNAAASTPALWHSVTVGHCWVQPGKSQTPLTTKKVQDTVSWLAHNRFSQLRDFSLCHWKRNVDFTLEVVSQFCPQLRTLKLNHCNNLSVKGFDSLSLYARSLESLNVQNSEISTQGFVSFLGSHGNQLKQILFSLELMNDKVLATIARGCCPDLQLLEVNKKIESEYMDLYIYVQALQIACPKLKTFRLLNVRPVQKTLRNVTGSSSGFPLLEELCIATASSSYLSDKDLLDILFNSPHLRVLDLRGCTRITPYGLAVLPCPELECLFWGSYSGYMQSSITSGLHMVTKKWSETLRELDIANQLFPEDDLDLAMNYLAQATETDKMRSLNLSGTRITQQALRLVLRQMTSLRYLNISSCRYLPRGMKRIYRNQEDICQLLDKLD